eukprot:GHRQ01022945.1.p1 GENE.GHRQ01022945.1~~GHRQ01022945.1.p1  ORF type:complete len:113 (+),score=16.15 GHRQ01022945.1:326-664(+)
MCPYFQRQQGHAGLGAGGTWFLDCSGWGPRQSLACNASVFLAELGVQRSIRQLCAAHWWSCPAQPTPQQQRGLQSCSMFLWRGGVSWTLPPGHSAQLPDHANVVMTMLFTRC